LHFHQSTYSQSTYSRGLYRWVFKCFLLLQLFSGAAFGESFDPIALYLTWKKNPESTMIIRWITHPTEVVDRVDYQPEGSDLWQTAIGYHEKLPRGASYLLHTVELSGLLSNTRYFFRTGSDAVVYKFQTMPAEAIYPIRFVAGGDMYHDALTLVRETNVQAAKTSPHFALVGGDIAYASDDKIPFLPNWLYSWIIETPPQKIDRWLSWLIAWKEDMVTPSGCLVPILPVIGNHDTDGRYDQTPAKAPFFYAFFAMPGAKGYNVLDFGNYMSIFLLDSGHTHSVKGLQKRWLATEMEKRATIPHKFALYHVPAYPSYRALEGNHSAQVRKNWVPIFEKYDLTAAFENHDHLYKRTYPILKGKIDPNGVRYFGDGAWGIEKPRKARSISKKWYLEKTVSSRHFLAVTLEGETRSVAAINPTGEILDQVSWK
jgi:acid phosphatase type 7